MRPSGLIGAGAAALLIVGLAVAGWWFREDILTLLDRDPAPTEISPATAAVAEEKLARLREGRSAATLSGIEVTSLLRFSGPPELNPLLVDPEVAFHADTVRMAARVATDRLPTPPELESVRMLLPDTARVEVVGTLIPLQPGSVAVRLEQASFAGIPIPERYYPGVLEQLGRRTGVRAEGRTLVVPLPEGVGAARVFDGFLILTP